MERSFQTKIAAHPSIYDSSAREMNIYFTTPEAGIDVDTGMMLLVPNYGEHPTYMEAERIRLSQLHNAVVVQCEYFGLRFMQGIQVPRFHIDINLLKQAFSEEDVERVYDGQQIDLQKLLEVGTVYPIHLNGEESMDESLAEFNDMGLMQAVDQLTAMFAVDAILRDNGHELNDNRVFAYAKGHGAYLALLCNAFAPVLFTTIIVEDSELFPPYLKGKRMLSGRKGKMTFAVSFEYLASTLSYDEEILRLPQLYRKFYNQCSLTTIHRRTQENKNLQEKRAFFDTIRSCQFVVLKNQEVNDPQQRFDQTRTKSDRNGRLTQPSVSYETKKYTYVIEYASGVPVLQRMAKNVHTLPASTYLQ